MKTSLQCACWNLVVLLALCLAAGCGGDSSQPCQPDCSGKACGDDGCGGSCGKCDPGCECDASGQCQCCKPNCAGKECGPDNCGGTCGDCQSDETCDQGQCVPGTSIAPRSGTWEYLEYTDSVNDCNSDELISNGAGPFRLTNKGNGTFEIQPGDESDPFTCTLSGAGFECPQRWQADVDMNPLDAVLRALVTASGTFTSNERMTGQQDAQAECAGSDCAVVEDNLGIEFPCHFKVQFVAIWKEAPQCNPNCSGRSCGPDPVCGQSCGQCQAGQTCNDAGQCVAEGVQPRSGVWIYDEYSSARNDCNTDTLLYNGDGFFDLTNHGDDTFTVVPGDESGAFTCYLNASSYTCQRRIAEVDWSPLDDAVLWGTAEVNGTFTSPQASNGEQVATVNCRGSYCTVLAVELGTDFPCTFTVQYAASWFSGF